MRSCDCLDQHTVMTKLNEQGIIYSIRSKPPNIILEIGFCTLFIPENIFKKFAEWYLKEKNNQESKGQKYYFSNWDWFEKLAKKYHED